MEFTYLDFLALFGIGGAHPGGLQLTKEILSQGKNDHPRCRVWYGTNFCLRGGKV
jgi:hypothetical protein